MIKVKESQSKNLSLMMLPHPFQTANEECESLRAQLEEQSRELQVTKEAVHELKVGLAGVLSRKGDLICFYWIDALQNAASSQAETVIGSDSIPSLCDDSLPLLRL